MIKGVNKQVLEINETQNGFFEKAIFFVKPEYCGMSEGRLKESAQKEMALTGRPPKSRPMGKSWVSKCVPLIIGFVIGIISGIIINSL